MLEKFDDSLSALEENMAQRLSKIERRLESLETVVSHIDLLQNRLLFIMGITRWSQRFLESRESLEAAKTSQEPVRREKHLGLNLTFVRMHIKRFKSIITKGTNGVRFKSKVFSFHRFA